MTAPPQPLYARANVELVCEDLVRTRQALEYVNIVTCKLTRDPNGANLRHERFRVTAKRDSYEFQSFARVEVWRDAGWALVHYLPGEDAWVTDLPTWTCRDLPGAREQFGDLGTHLLDIACRVVA